MDLYSFACRTSIQVTSRLPPPTPALCLPTCPIGAPLRLHATPLRVRSDLGALLLALRDMLGWS